MFSLEDELYHLLGYYKRMPDRIRNFFIYPLKIFPRSIYQGENYKKIKKEADDFEFADKESIAKFQTNKILNLVHYCYDNIPFYKQYWDLNSINIKDIQNMSDFTKIPLIDREIVQQYFNELLNPNFPLNKRLMVNTGGSTGVPLKLAYLKGYSRIADRAFWDTQFERIGCKRGAKVARLRGDFIGKNRLSTYDAYRNTLILNTFLLSEKNADDYLSILDKYKVEYLQVHPAALFNLIQSSSYDNYFIKSLKFIVLNSENIYDWQIEKLEYFFNTKNFFFGYGQVEMVSLAGTCEYSRLYHFHPAYSFTEFENTEQKLDGQNIFEIVGTGFYNPLMPLVRYKTGDLCVKSSLGCTCNRNHILAGQIVGRSQYIAIGKNNEQFTLGALIFGRHGKFFEHIKKIQIINEAPGKLTVKIIPKNSFAKEHEKEITNMLSHKEGMPFEVKLDVVSFIESTKLGKHKFFIKNF